MDHQIPEPPAEDLERISKLLRHVGGQNVAWGAQQSLDVWVIEQPARLVIERCRPAHDGQHLVPHGANTTTHDLDAIAFGPRFN
ncbi:hypothetical protein [Arthrobacter methylotrophus]|uniref:Uncharacterized protein n=2 Tax=Arthrobacter methylotrophus TaxID=121291 RepID=A0ABV5ULE2_9MICC